MLSNSYKKILEDLEKIKNNPLSIIEYVFVFGSVAKCCIKNTSDIDLLLLGRQEKTIKLRMAITEHFDDLNLNNEIDYVYYDIESFNKIKYDNMFLKSLENHIMTLEDMINFIKEGLV